MQADLGPFTILIRFSYPARAGLRVGAGDPRSLAERLYDPARLARRFALFEALTLPSLKAQSDRDFRTLLLTGEGFPGPARARLDRLIADLPGAEVVTLPPLHAQEAVQQALAVVPAGRRWQVTLRLDDDDALDVEFIARLRRTVQTLLPLQGGDTPLVVAFNRGYVLDLTGARPAFTPVVERLPTGCGTAMIAPVASGETIYRRNHRWLPQFYDVFTEARSPAFVRAVHGDNDGDGAVIGRTVVTPGAALAAELARGFPFLPAAWSPANGSGR